MDSVRKIGLLLIAMFGTLTAAAQAQSGPESAPGEAHRLLDAARLAMGGAAWERVHLLHVQMSLTAGGLDGTVENWADPAHDRYASRYTLGPDRGAEGWDGQGAWTVDWGGRVHRVDEKSLAPPRASAVWQSYAYLFAERNGIAVKALGRRRDEDGHPFDVVQLSAPGTSPVDLWLDAQTALPGRVVVKGNPDLVISYADYRDVQGLKLPGTVRASTGLVRYDHVAVRGTTEIDPQIAADPFAAPPQAPPDYRFEAGETRSTSLLTSTGDAFLIDVTINGKGPYRFALDTGASNAIDTDLAAELGLPVAGTLSARGAGELPVDIGLTRVARVEIGDLTLDDQLFRVLPLSQIVAGDRPPYRGLLGYEFFDRFVVTLDQNRHEVELYEPNGWSYRGGVTPVPFAFHGRMPVVEGQIDLVPGRFTLDTGQANSLTLYRPFIQRTGIQRKYVPKLTAIVGEGIGGPIRAEVARGQRLLLGDTLVTGPVVFLSLQKTGAFSDPDLAGNVGGGVFLRYNTTFDYARRQVYFERVPTYGFGDGLKLMTVKRSFNGLLVLSVLPGGPMADAGLKRGDVIESLDNKNATTLDDLQMQKIFRKPAGTKVPMTIRSEGRLKDIVVILGEIV
jgi:Aspartyl protease/PDZ domain